jgi:hypothetical protein
MNSIIKKNLQNNEDNFILPFFWLHGETEEVLRKYMGAINDCGIGAVCVESRPHPDFCGDKWWQDMDVILDEARKRSMKVWILDDSHFPTGYANGALEQASAELCRQSIFCQKVDIDSNEKNLSINLEKYLSPEFKKNMFEQFIMPDNIPIRTFDDNSLISVTALPDGGGEPVDITSFVTDNVLTWQIPEGKWNINICALTRNLGPHRSYINMMNAQSCRVLIDAVYEPHYAHYKDDFGNTIAGFFSDEPELGNGHLYKMDNYLGTEQDLPWSCELQKEMENSLGQGWQKWMPLLWDNGQNSHTTARIRYAYMNAVTRLVEKDFSYQIGDWCHAHNVEYIGHIIEDNNQHARTGSSLGHFFRGMAGQDMSGIDDIGGQVLPQAEDFFRNNEFMARDGEFYHYTLGKLGASLGAIDPRKKGRTMCEIFGAYGWTEGVQLEKYLADHFMVRGVNRFVPHAFSAKDYPDPDCPPHFYANGNDPLYRHFGKLMKYMNRVCGLISGGRHISPIAILYHGEAEWTGSYMQMQKPAHKLADRQIDYDFLPTDVFAEKEHYKTHTGNTLTVNIQEYRALVVPKAQFVSAAFAKEAALLHKSGFPVIFVEALPGGIYDGENSLMEELKDCPVVALEDLVTYLDENHIPEISLAPASNRVRYLHYENQCHLYYFVNEAAEVYHGTITVPQTGKCYAYNAWDNRLETVKAESDGNVTKLNVTLEPRKSLIVLFDDAEGEINPPVEAAGKEISIENNWKRSTCRSIEYPNFKDSKTVELPDNLAEEKPDFSGFVRYENSFTLEKTAKAVLEITDAAEGVEVFINHRSAGIQIVPYYVFDVSSLVKEGENHIVIEVATTLEREVFSMTGPGHMASIMGPKEPTALSGITGTVKIFTE